jgi:hypothetical protein
MLAARAAVKALPAELLDTPARHPMATCRPHARPPRPSVTPAPAQEPSTQAPGSLTPRGAATIADPDQWLPGAGRLIADRYGNPIRRREPSPEMRAPDFDIRPTVDLVDVRRTGFRFDARQFLRDIYKAVQATVKAFDPF